MLVGRAVAAARSFRITLAQAEVERAAAVAPRPADPSLDATIAYLRGFVLSRLGRWEEAVPLLQQALGQFGREHFMTGAVLDVMGRVYAGKCNFQAAREFYKLALECKRQAGDEAGLSVSYEELGRLYLDWDQPDAAEEQLSEGLQLAQRRGDEGGQAQLLNHLGRVALARVEREVAQGKKASALRKLWKQAGEYLEECITFYQRSGRAVPEGRARKYLAMVRLNEGDTAAAEEQLRQAEEILRGAGHPQGQIEVQWFLSRVRRAQGRPEEAVTLLRQAVAGYDNLRQQAEGARAQFELARALAEMRSPPRLVVQTLEDALRRAEACRRGNLVEEIEEELRDTDEEAHWRHVFRRVRGHGAPEATASLSSGTSEMATVMFLNLQGFVPFCQGLDPEEVMLTLNQLLADLEGVLTRHGAHVTTYLGGGFMALLRQAEHAERALSAALELLQVIAEFNRPREVLGLRQLPARLGIASGAVFLGNIGTYRKMSFTAVGGPVNLAARLMRQVVGDAPCVSQETRELGGDRFLYRSDSPRQVDLPDIGRRQVWDLVGRKPKQPSGLSGRGNEGA
jgi:class 3 adenylate cyclase